MNKNQQMKEMVNKLFPSTTNSYDILYDLYNIISERLLLFKNNIDETEKWRAEYYLNDIRETIFLPRKRKIEYKYRLYIISGVQFVSLVCLELNSESIEKIIHNLKIEFLLYDKIPIESIDPNAVSTIYIFKENEVIYCDDFFPAHLVWISQMLQSKNILAYNLLDDWIIE